MSKPARHCHHCGHEYSLPGNPGRSESCERCSSDLKVCLNCNHHDVKAAEQCRERRADLVQEKHAANFCEYFEFAKRVWVPPSQQNHREQGARDALRKLLGD